MRVGIITYDFYPPIGGQGTETYSLYKELMKSDHVNVIVFSSRENNFRNHIKISALDGSIGPLFFSFIVSLRLDKIISKYKLKLLNIYGGPGGVFLMKKPSVPVVYVANHTYAQQSRYLSNRLYNYMKKLERFGYTISDKIIAISSSTKESLIEDYGIPPEKIYVIHPGVDQATFKPLKFIEKIPNSVLYVGRLNKRKGIENLVKAIKYVAEDIPTVKLYIIGDGPLRSNLKKLVKKIRLEDSVVFLGKVPVEELVKWYNKAEVFVIASLFEGFGIAPLEAMACGTPVITSNTSSLPEVVGNAGILVDPYDTDGLAKAIYEVLTNEELRKDLSKRGLERAKMFSWKKTAEETLRVYKEVYNRGE